MKRILFSALINTVTLPVLGKSSSLPPQWLYGSSSVKQVESEKVTEKSKVRLVFKVEANVLNEHVYVSDLAECFGEVSLCKEISTVDLFPSPKAGQESRHSSSHVIEILKEELPNIEISSEGSQSITMRAHGVLLNEGTIRTALENQWTSLDHKPLRFMIISMRYPKILKLRHLDYDFNFPDLTEVWMRLKQTPRRSTISLQVDAIPRGTIGSEKISFTIQVAVRAEINAAVALKDIEKGTKAEEGLFKWDWVPYQEQLVTEKDFLTYKSFRTNVRTGVALRAFDLLRDPDVRRGEHVDAAISKGGVKMVGSGQALDSGIIGQKIRVQLESTKRQVFGLITAKSQIEVELP